MTEKGSIVTIGIWLKPPKGWLRGSDARWILREHRSHFRRRFRSRLDIDNR